VFCLCLDDYTRVVWEKRRREDRERNTEPTVTKAVTVYTLSRTVPLSHYPFCGVMEGGGGWGIHRCGVELAEHLTERMGSGLDDTDTTVPIVLLIVDLES